MEDRPGGYQPGSVITPHGQAEEKPKPKPAKKLNPLVKRRLKIIGLAFIGVVVVALVVYGVMYWLSPKRKQQAVFASWKNYVANGDFSGSSQFVTSEVQGSAIVELIDQNQSQAAYHFAPLVSDNYEIVEYQPYKEEGNQPARMVVRFYDAEANSEYYVSVYFLPESGKWLISNLEFGGGQSAADEPATSEQIEVQP